MSGDLSEASYTLHKVTSKSKLVQPLYQIDHCSFSLVRSNQFCSSSRYDFLYNLSKSVSA